MIEITIPGLRVASKKNNRRNFSHISLPSLAYEKFKSLVAEHLLPYQGSITTPFRMRVWYTIKGKYHQDIDNACSSILDVLTDYQVITDDDLCQELTISKTSGKDWCCLVRLEEI
jgi:Holliday junction resolvase RusA-like endonuclease